jgi:hypothetical protein
MQMQKQLILNIMAKKVVHFNWTGFATHKLISARVEDGAKANIVLVFSSIKPFTNAVIADFAPAGTVKTFDLLTKSTLTNSLTLRVTVAYAKSDPISVVYTPSTPKGEVVTFTVTNAIA